MCDKGVQMNGSLEGLEAPAGVRRIPRCKASHERKGGPDPIKVPARSVGLPPKPQAGPRQGLQLELACLLFSFSRYPSVLLLH